MVLGSRSKFWGSRIQLVVVVLLPWARSVNPQSTAGESFNLRARVAAKSQTVPLPATITTWVAAALASHLINLKP